MINNLAQLMFSNIIAEVVKDLVMCNNHVSFVGNLFFKQRIWRKPKTPNTASQETGNSQKYPVLAYFFSPPLT